MLQANQDAVTALLPNASDRFRDARWPHFRTEDRKAETADGFTLQTVYSWRKEEESE